MNRKGKASEKVVLNNMQFLIRGSTVVVPKKTVPKTCVFLPILNCTACDESCFAERRGGSCFMRTHVKDAAN